MKVSCFSKFLLEMARSLLFDNLSLQVIQSKIKRFNTPSLQEEETQNKTFRGYCNKDFHCDIT